MPTGSHVTEFARKRVKDYEPGKGLKTPGRICPRLAIDPHQHQAPKFLDVLAAFLAERGVEKVTALVVGAWNFPDSSEPIVEALVAARDKLPKLRALFLGDITPRESEISWIQQTDMGPLLKAYPRLEEFRVRGSQGLSFGKLRHEELGDLTVESGGLPATVVREILAAQLPCLARLELWFGEEDYGGDTTLKDLRPLLSGRKFPMLFDLSLRNCTFADELAVALAKSPLLKRIHALDLCMGTLGDKGAQALLDCPEVPKLGWLNISHHFVSKGMVEKLKALGIRDFYADYPQEDDEEFGRFVAISE